MSGELEKLISGKSDLSSVRQSAKRHPDLKEGFKAAMQPVVRLVSEGFRKMRLKKEKVRTFPAALDEEIEDIMSILSLIDEEITPSDAITMTSKDFARRQRLTSFLEKHSKQTHYTFQLKKCTSANCNVCVLSPTRLPPEVFDTLSFLPDPMLDPSGEHYLSFAELYGKPTTEADRPSLKQPTQKSETDKKRKQLLVAAKVRDVISCGECRKPRCIYAASKLLAEEGGAVTRAQQDGTYVCGGHIFAEGGRYHDKIVTKVDLTCASPVETQYYGSVTVAFPDCCFHCGTLSNLLEQTDPYILELRQSYHTVRPICSPCHAGGKQASTRGPTNARKKIRKI
ncbi:PREDICTED: uncharacterized protein LOC109475723 [Branchiostoma belcheri]|uniref:Uncharacterized protein LOC109475723 n=1 Tax=Branchiostoma belcheri TaxID=7741 RepID=A0A6P4ZQY3_BRABE|nr:PREDICTED: uncharacterized protein LOC109475723 [Branchiostoma belcheri]